MSSKSSTNISSHITLDAIMIDIYNLVKYIQTNKEKQMKRNYNTNKVSLNAIRRKLKRNIMCISYKPSCLRRRGNLART